MIPQGYVLVETKRHVPDNMLVLKFFQDTDLSNRRTWNTLILYPPGEVQQSDKAPSTSSYFRGSTRTALYACQAIPCVTLCEMPVLFEHERYT